MVQPSGAQQGLPATVRFSLGLQLNRLGFYAFFGAVGLLFKQLGTLQTTYTALAGTCLVGALSAVVFYGVYGRGLDQRWPFSPAWLWVPIDIGLTTLGAYAIAGPTFPWYLFYLAILSETAFEADLAAVVLVGAVNIAAYLGFLVWTREIRGLDSTFYVALSRIVVLHGIAFSFLPAIINLKQKRQIIKRLQEEESRKVVELRRLTLALDERTHEIAEANVSIQEASRLKSRFLANMSHELRTPLNAVIGFSEILVNRLADVPVEQQVRFLQNIHTSGKHLLGLINDILDLSKVESGKMTLHPELFGVDVLVHGVVGVMKGMTDKRRITLVAKVAKDLPPVEADPVRFKQILYNLASNAVKFSPEGTTVTIVASHLPPEGSPLREEAIQVAVTDQGIGIDPKDQQVIFEEFRQADGAATRRHEGTGLGLALVKRFVEMHRGVVAVGSAPGDGSTFTVTLPTRFRRPAPGSETAPSAQASDRHRRVLVVEDDLSSYEAISEPLLAAGYLPVRAHHGDEAMNLARTLDPAAITLDLGLPGRDGWEVLKAIKGDPTTSGIPVIIVSMSDNRELGLSLGADDYFLKPVDRDRLVQRLGELLRLDDRASTVLVIDDEPEAHALLEEVLTPAGYHLVHATSGPDGLAKAALERPELVILDLMMEGMNGFEVASQLKGEPKTRDIPIMILTAKDLTGEERTLLQGKIATLVQKGQTSSQLASQVQGLLRRHAR